MVNFTNFLILFYKYTIKILSYFFLKSKENKEKLLNIKNSHLGENCFLIGNGPSLSSKDLDLISSHNIFSIASNNIHKLSESTTWRPNITVIDDFSFLLSIRNIKKIIDFPSDFLFTRIDYSALFNYKKAVFCNFEGGNKLLINPKFSFDLLSNIYSIGTVSYVMIQLAVFMGFNKIYLIGFDHKFQFELNQHNSLTINRTPNHFYNDTSKMFVKKFEMDIAYEKVKSQMKTSNFNVVNLSRNTNLQIFEKGDFDEVIKS
jgi:hypothetical protein